MGARRRPTLYQNWQFPCESWLAVRSGSTANSFVNIGLPRQVLVTLNPARPDPTSGFPGRRPPAFRLGASAPSAPRPVGPCFPTHSCATVCSLYWILVLPDVFHPWASLSRPPGTEPSLGRLSPLCQKRVWRVVHFCPDHQCLAACTSCYNVHTGMI